MAANRERPENPSIPLLGGTVGNHPLESSGPSSSTYGRLLENGADRQLERTVGNRSIEDTVPTLYLPYEFSSILMATANTDPFGIDPEQTSIVP